MVACSSNMQPLLALQLYQWQRRQRRPQQKQPEGHSGRSKVSPHMYTEAMRAALAAGAVSAALDVWRDAQQEGATRDVILICTYMRALLRAHRCAQVVQMWSTLVDAHGTLVPMHAHVVAMRAMAASGMGDRALALYEDLYSQPNCKLPGAAPTCIPIGMDECGAG
jgi:hypothetical protein